MIIACTLIVQATITAANDRPCRNDIEQFCVDIKAGNGRMVECLRKHHEALSQALRAFGKAILESAQESGKGEHLAVTHADVMGYFVAVGDLPFIEPVRRDEAKPVLEGSMSGRFPGYGLDPVINGEIQGMKSLSGYP
jgi:hypothetical protein